MQQDNRAEARASLLSLFQQKPSQSAENPTESQQQPPSSTHNDLLQLQHQAELPFGPSPQPSESTNQDIDSLFRNLVSPVSNPASIPPELTNTASPAQTDPSSLIETAPSNTDRQTALLSLLGSVAGGGPSPASTSSNLNNAANRQSGMPSNTSGSEFQGKALLESIMAGTQMTAPISSPNPTGPSPPIRQNSLETQEAPRKNLFDYVSPYEAFMAPMEPTPAPPPPQAAPQNQVAAASSLSRKKPVPAYNPSPAPQTPSGSLGGSPQQQHVSPVVVNNQSPVMSQNGRMFLQGPLSDNDQYNDIHSADGRSRGVMSVDSASESGRQTGSQSGVPPQGPLPPIPSGVVAQNQARVSPIPNQRQQQLAQTLGQQQQAMQLQNHSPPLRPAHPPPARAPSPSQVQQPLPPVQQPQQQQPNYQPQAVRGRGSPASVMSRDSQPRPQPTGGRDSPGPGRRAGNGNGNKNNQAQPQVQYSQQSQIQQQIQQQQQQMVQHQQQQQQQIQQQQQQQQQAAKEKRPQGTLTTSQITIDVNGLLRSTLAPENIAHVTPIALLKLEPTYLPGTTIGVANFIAYSMTRGRVRLIGRETGARALIRLPETFPANSSVQDMAISGTRLACVTNDGGLVVWDVPGDIEDDVQSRIILHVLPSPDASRFKVVKWHPKQPGTLAVASEREIYLLQVDEAHSIFGAEGIRQDELGRISKVFSIPSPLVSFTFDVPQIALASISVDSTITLWSIKDKLPFWTGRVAGEGSPSSIDFLEGGLVVGRNQGNILQLLPIMSTTVLSTVRFVLGPNGRPEEEQLMFGHLSYDATLKTLWVANSARASLFAIKIGTDSSPVQPNQQNEASPSVRPSFDQIIEFPCQNSTINLTLVAAEGGEPGNTWVRDSSLAVCAFSVHAGGVDQINIDRDAFENALNTVPAKLPNVVYTTLNAEKRTSGQGQMLNIPPQLMQQQQQPSQQQIPQSNPNSQFHQPYNQPVYQPQGPVHQVSSSMPPPSVPRVRTPPSDLDRLVAAAASAGPYDLNALQQGPGQQQQQPTLQQQQQQMGGKGKGKEAIGAGRNYNSNKNSGSGSDAPVVKTATAAEVEAMASGVNKEIKRVEESLHNRIGRLIVKELDKQHSRLEEVRQADQTADFERQEKILKLISNELTKNTTRVVEQAVKSVVQNSVLPALENVTKNEVKAALNGQIAKGLTESMKQTLPTEVERLLLRPDVSNHVARTFSTAITPLIERHVKDSITKTLIPAYTQASSVMQQELAREMQLEMSNIKKEVVSWQSETLKGTENLIRDMEQSIRGLAEQVKMLSVQISNSNAAAAAAAAANKAPPPSARSVQELQSMPSDYGMQQHMRQQNMPPQSQSAFASIPYQPPQQNWNPPTQQMAPPLPPPSLPSQMAHIPPVQQSTQSTPQQPRNEDWDEIFLTNLGYQDAKELRDLLSRCGPDLIMPTGGQTSPLSQAVILTLIHRLALSLAELSPADEAFKSSLWWLQRASLTLRPNDNVIAPYVNRVLQTALSTLNTTASRVNVIPGGASIETNTMIGQIQQSLANLM